MSDAPPTAAPVPPVPIPLMEISAARAIALFRWWGRLGIAFNALMIAAIVLTSAVGLSRGLGSTPMVAAGVVWFAVLTVSVRARRLAIDAVPLIAAGEFGLAEDRLTQSLRSFSVLRSTKLFGLQQLALLRHAQGRWADAAMLCRELLARPRRGEGALDLPCRLMLAESLLEVGDVQGVDAELARIAWARLNLRETLLFTHLRLDLQARWGRWDEMIAHAEPSMTLAELMPANMSARCHALLALAAQRAGREDWRALLARRAGLLADPAALIAARPFLRDAFVAPPIPDGNAARADSSPQSR